MVEHGRGNVRLEYGRRLFSAAADGGRAGDFTLKVSVCVCFKWCCDEMLSGFFFLT